MSFLHKTRIFLSLIAVVELASATSPPIRIFQNTPITQQTKTIATKILNDLKPYFATDDRCALNIDEVFDNQVYTNIETVYRYELKLTSSGQSCFPQTKICSGIKVFIPAPQYCDDPVGECFVLFKPEEIQCIPDIIVEPLPATGRIVPDPNNNPIIKDIAEQATQFLYNQYDPSLTCPLVLDSIIEAREQEVGNGLDFEFVLNVATNALDYPCEFQLKNCAKVKVHQPRCVSLCPGNIPCIYPQQLNQVECTALPQVLF